MSNPLETVMLDLPAAATIWMILVTAAAVVLGATAGSRIRAHLRGRPPRRSRPARREDDLGRYADEVAVAAQRAAATARRQRQQWLATQATVEEAWRAFDDADTRARRLAATAALRAPCTPRTPAEYASRERFLHRAALAACGRHGLSIYQLSDALAHRNGWDPRLHPVEQEVRLSRAVRDHLAAVHTTAASREREAWHRAEAAAVAAHSLQAEAIAAARAAARVQPRLAPQRVVGVARPVYQPALQTAG
jgi:hypothetical protein